MKTVSYFNQNNASGYELKVKNTIDVFLYANALTN